VKWKIQTGYVLPSLPLHHRRVEEQRSEIDSSLLFSRQSLLFAPDAAIDQAVNL